MNIAIFSDNFYPEMSGISDSIILLAKGLAARGHRINFYVPRYSRRDFAVSKLPYCELDLGENIRIVRMFSFPFPSSPTKQGRIVFPALSQYRSVKKFDPDVIYTQDFFGAGLEALFLSKLLKKPLVGTSHTPITEFLKYSPIKMKWLLRASVRFVNWYYRHCAVVSAPSQAILSEMERNGFKTKNFVRSNPLELSRFVPVSSLEEKARLKKMLGLSEHTMLYTGRIAEEKGIDVVLRAMAIVKKTIPDIAFAITGHGAAEASLKKLAQELGLKKQVFFFGYLDDGAFTDVYQASDIFVIMSTAETQCLSMMQGFASGLPAIGADAYGLSEYIRPDVGFLIPPGDVQQLAERIAFLFAHPEERKRLGENARRYVQSFSLEAIVVEWEKTFQSFAKEKKVSEQENGEGLKLSFVIPAYNEEAYLGACLESVMRETRGKPYEVEIIVVNNASTDKTGDVARSFPDVRVVDEPRKGLVSARRTGYLVSSGNLIANVDADTRLPDGWVKRVFREFSHDPDLVALSGPYIYCDLPFFTGLFVKAFYAFGYLVHRINSFFKKGAMLQGGNYVVRRPALEKIGGFNTNFDFYGEDTDIAVRIRKAGTVKWDFDLPMYTSARRLKDEGVIKTGFRYALNHFWTTAFGKPFTKKFRDIR